MVAVAQSDPDAANALHTYKAERLRQCSEIVLNAKARGHVTDWSAPELVVETLSSFAWGRLLTDSLDLSDGEMRLFVRQLTCGLQVQ